MAVASRGAALSALRALINHDPVPAGTLLHRPYLPAGMDPSPDPVRMDPSTVIGGYADESRYELGGGDPTARLAIAGPPAAALLADRSTITSDTVAAFLKSSIDLTMQGGTTSGVVYPLAVCELATQFRFRNVGGASAGAIAAAVSAAAELGRSEAVRHPESAAESAAAAAPGVDLAPGVPRIRRGFVGVSDILSWLTQTRPGDPEAEEFRLAQLFRPGPSGRRVYRVAIAVMRQQFWSLPLVLLMAFGWVTRVLTVGLLAGAVALTGWVGARFVGRTELRWWQSAGWGLLDAAAFVATVVGVGLWLQLAGWLLSRRPEGEVGVPGWLNRLRHVSSGYQMPTASAVRRLLPTLALTAVVVGGVVWRPWGYLAGLIVGLAGAVAVGVVLVAAGVAFVTRLGDRSYGLIAGTAEHRHRDLIDLLAGAPKATVHPSLVPWLANCLNQLAGLPSEQVLRFGHLWWGLDYLAIRDTLRADEAGMRTMAARTDHRLVNLELMTTDLTRQRPYRFPLPPTEPDDERQLWLCLDKLSVDGSPIFPATIMAVLAEEEQREVQTRSGEKLILHRLPQPWDLPVIVAVRISMSLPVLFQAIRMYRIVRPGPVHDDFGRAIVDNGTPLPGNTSVSIAEELWFSDGGITSNFPVHFFDASLPRWPTVSLNLGRHPEDSPHQDVSLPQDWDTRALPLEPLTGSGLSFGGAVFSTAMSWRDSMQSAMPGYRNRIAQVRTRANEGGTNLFMPREVIASMALRGALAGARLRTRFADESQWNRFRWLRLRVALSNLERLRTATGDRRGFYADACDGPEWLAKVEANFSEGPVGVTVPWYRPQPAFWPKAPRLVNTFVDGYRPEEDPANVMTTDVPRPEPVLRQVPQD